MHALVDGLGMLIRFSVTGGQASDTGEALPLLGEWKPLSLAADKAYDANAILQHLKSLGIQTVIPSKENRLEQRTLDKHLYVSRNLLERFFCLIKQFRRVATRYDKLLERFASFVALTAAFICLCELSIYPRLQGWNAIFLPETLLQSICTHCSNVRNRVVNLPMDFQYGRSIKPLLQTVDYLPLFGQAPKPFPAKTS